MALRCCCGEGKTQLDSPSAVVSSDEARPRRNIYLTSSFERFLPHHTYQQHPQCLRAARLKPVANRPNFESFTRREFTRNIALDKKDFSAIEFLLRKGQKQLEVYEAPNIRNIAG
jgi:succinate dehydrogenase assembly factor 1